jgi:hypothetical protein
MAGSSLFLNLARVAKVAALLLFLLPFVTVSCSTRDLATVMSNGSGAAAEPPPSGVPDHCVLVQASGLQLALGTAEASRSCLGAFADMGNESSQQADPDSPFAQNDYAVIGAAAVLLLTLLLGFLLKGMAGIILGIAGSLAAICAVAWSVFVRVPNAVFGAPPRSGSGPQLTPEQAQHIFSVSPGLGFWLMAGALILAIICYVLALGGRRSAPPQTPPSP